jgi:DNA polymerase III subunit delta'
VGSNGSGAAVSVWESLYQSRSVTSVQQQMASDEAAHAWLLIGPGGTAKGALAACMAAALNCTTEPGRGCGRCLICTRIMNGRHPDVHRIVPEGPIIPVDLVREVILPEAARSPFEGRSKVFIIEEAERMNPPAQNALLKTLEEPPPDCVFVLISDREEELLETVISRCRIVRLEAVPENSFVEFLVARGADENLAIAATRLYEGDGAAAARLALEPEAAARRDLWLHIPERLKSPTDALDIAAEIMDEMRAFVKEREREQRQEAAELAEAMGEGRGTGAVRNSLAKRHKRELRRAEELMLDEVFRCLASFYRDVLVLRSQVRERVINLDMAERLERWDSSDIQGARLMAAAERCVAARSAIERNANTLLNLEATLVDLTRWVAPALQPEAV